MKNFKAQTIEAGFAGGVVYLDGESSTIFENIKISNISVEKGGFLYVNKGKLIQIFNSSIENIFSLKNGAVIYVSTIKFMLINFSSFYNSFSGNNGVIFISSEEENSVFSFFNNMCIFNDARKGSCLYIISSSAFYISNLSCTNNEGNLLTFTWPFSIKLYLENIKISNHNISFEEVIFFSGFVANLWEFNFTEINSNNHLIYLESAELFLSNGQFSLINCQFIFISKESYIFFREVLCILETSNKENSNFFSFIYGTNLILCLQDSIFQNMRSNIAIFYLDSGESLINNCTFLENENIIFYLLNINFNVENSSFQYNFDSDISKPNNIYFEDPITKFFNVTFKSCYFLDFYEGASVFFGGNLYISIFDSKFINYNNNTNNHSIQDLQALKVINCVSFILMNNIFEFYNNGAASLDFSNFNRSNLKISQIMIKDNKFLFNSGTCGSCLKIIGNHLKIKIIDNLFFSNLAKRFDLLVCSGVAAGIYFHSEFKEYSSILLSKNVFTNNFAEFISPNVFSSIAIEDDSNNIFHNNSDSFNFTVKLFSFPIKWIFNFDSFYSLPKFDFLSGNKLNFEAFLIDFFNQTLFFDNDTSVAIKNKKQNNFTINLENSLGLVNLGKISLSSFIIKTFSY